MEKALVRNDHSKVKDSWDRGNSCNSHKDYPYGYPWPPKNYTCSFCQKEFKSAQALGGHMNIHRRDRAKLRAQSPDNFVPDQNPNPSPSPNSDSNHKINPNPDHETTTRIDPDPVWILPNWGTGNPNNHTNLPPSSSQTNIYAHQYSLVSLSLSSLQPSTKDGEKLNGPLMGNDHLGRGFEGSGKWKDLTSLEVHHDIKDHEANVSKSDSSKDRLDLESCHGEPKEGVDLELRLGI